MLSIFLWIFGCIFLAFCVQTAIEAALANHEKRQVENWLLYNELEDTPDPEGDQEPTPQVEPEKPAVRPKVVYLKDFRKKETG